MCSLHVHAHWDESMNVSDNDELCNIYRKRYRYYGLLNSIVKPDNMCELRIKYSVIILISHNLLNIAMKPDLAGHCQPV